jgi:hypothetical protein
MFVLAAVALGRLVQPQAQTRGTTQGVHAGKCLIACERSVIRHDVFVSDVFSIEGGQRAIPAVSAYNTPASIEPCVFGAGHAF